MAIRVDPFLHPIPNFLTRDKETREFFEYWIRWSHDMWARTGGGDDAVAETQIGELYEPGIQTSNADELVDELLNADNFAGFELLERIEELESDMELFAAQSVDIDTISETVAGAVVVTSSNYTTDGNEIVIATSNITATLNSAPADGERVSVKRATTAGTVTIDGNGNNIDGSSTATLLYNYETITMIYSVDNDEWLII